MNLYLLSFLAGILTVLAPCVLPLLPVIIGGSITGKLRKPITIIVSLSLSLFLFTFLLKVSSVFVNIDPMLLSYFSGGIIIFLGLISIFPKVWDKISLKLGFSSKSDNLLENAREKDSFLGDIFTGLALGPVFSSCSPTFAFALATTLRGNFIEGIVNLTLYIIGLSSTLLLISILGRRFTNKVKFLANPNGIFKKAIGVIFVIVGLILLFGLEKQIQIFVAERTFNITNVEQKLLNQNTLKESSTKLSAPENSKQAAEIEGIAQWINSEPLSIEKLKGKVVLVDFWTYSCINCLRTLPYLNSWHESYKDDNFVLIGVHAPEFAFEKNPENVIKATKEYGVKYPVAMDNDFKTWDNYDNNSWPAKYLIDKDGKVRYTHFGEGDYKETEEAIVELIGETGKQVDIKSKVTTSQVQYQDLTPETYLGWSRQKLFANKSEIKYNEKNTYTSVNELEKDNWTLNGDWTINDENIVSNSDTSTLKIKYNAKNVYLVAGNPTSSQSKSLTVKSSDGKTESLLIEDNKLYTIVQNQDIKTDTIEITVPEGLVLNAFTFG